MSIPYNFEVIKTDLPARVMEVVYTSPGRQTFHISMPLPAVGESVDDVVKAFAPIGNWLAVEREVLDVPVGTSGALEFFTQQPAPSGPPTQQQIIERFESAIQQRLDFFAQQRGYDGILSAVTYASSPVPRFAQEGTHAKLVRDNTWIKAYEILDQVLAGLRPMPSNPDEIFPELPSIEWPSQW